VSDTPPFSVIAEASIHLDAAACQLYLAGQYRYPDPLPPWESRDASDMRTEARYVAAESEHGWETVGGEDDFTFKRRRNESAMEDTDGADEY
jgi:hypothetical protein